MAIDIASVSAGALQVVALAEQGKYLEAAKRSIELGLDLVPAEQLSAFLTDAAAARANEIANAAEGAKFGG